MKEDGSSDQGGIVRHIQIQEYFEGRANKAFRFIGYSSLREGVGIKKDSHIFDRGQLRNVSGIVGDVEGN